MSDSNKKLSVNRQLAGNEKLSVNRRLAKLNDAARLTTRSRGDRYKKLIDSLTPTEPHDPEKLRHPEDQR